MFNKYIYTIHIILNYHYLTNNVLDYGFRI